MINGPLQLQRVPGAQIDCVDFGRRGRVRADRREYYPPLLRLLTALLATWPAVGLPGAYLEFDGQDDRVVSTDIDIVSQITLEAWIRPNSISNTKAQDRVLSKGSVVELMVSRGDTGCHFGTAGHVQWRAKIGGVDQRVCGGTLTDSAWHHIASTYDGVRARIYVDGSLVADAARSGPIATNNAKIHIGIRPTLARPFHGAIDEVRIWSVALTQAQIQEYMNQGRSGFESGLQAYYRFDEASGQTAFDSSVKGRNATLGASSNADSADPLWIAGSQTSSDQIWPTNGWLTASASEVGMSDAELNQARDYALTGGGSGFITRYGKLVKSWGNAGTLYDLKSSTKSLGGTVLGLAMADNLVRLDDSAQMHLPSIGVPPSSNASTGWLDDIKILHLATHTAGFEKTGGYGAITFAPGSAWQYSDGGANWLADLLTVRFGQDLNSVMFARVLTQLGLTSVDLAWRNNAYRTDTIYGIKSRELGSGIRANVDAMARIGYLYLRNGIWDGQPILPTSFISQISRPAPEIVGLPVLGSTGFGNASDHYGVLWWTNADGTLPRVPTDAYWSWGLKDSLVIVIPSLDIVASRAGSGWRSDWSPDYSVLAPFIQPIVDAVQVP